MVSIRRIACLVCLSLSSSLFITEIGFAQDSPANPLETEIDRSDPVIPLGYQRRELSTFEINRIKREMVKLDRTAKDELQQGQEDKAFKLWYRQLKLARAAGIEVEIEALGEVGEIAWQANRGGDLRNIANRLITLESGIKEKERSPEVLQQLANAYQQVRYLEQAIAIWSEVLAYHQQRSNLVEVEDNLQTLGRLHLARFDYQSAEKVYQQLLTNAQTNQIDPKIDAYLATLTSIYDRTKQIQKAICTRQDSIETYKTTGKQDKIPQLKLAIANDYVALEKTAKAIEAYESAFTLAKKNQRLAIAENALDSLGQLYQQQGQEKKAIATLNRLLKVQRQSYNHYGLVNTYDTLGKIYLRSNRNKKAKHNFEQALELAKTLNYKVSYFNSQIKKL